MDNINEIKKQLYKVNPIARLIFVDKDNITYCASFSHESHVVFKVPLNDIHEAKFKVEMEGKLLIRWIHGSSILELTSK